MSSPSLGNSVRLARLHGATLCLAVLLAACAHSEAHVQRVGVDEVTDLSGRWNDTDSRLTAQAMVSDCLTRPWLEKASTGLGHQPVVIVGRVRNRTQEHINTRPFVEELQRALINSQKVTFVASGREREQLRDEREDQDLNASDDTRKEMGQEKGADYLLEGTIDSVVDSAGDGEIISYQVNLKLMDLQTNEIAWNGEKRIKKRIAP